MKTPQEINLNNFHKKKGCSICSNLIKLKEERDKSPLEIDTSVSSGNSVKHYIMFNSRVSSQKLGATDTVLYSPSFKS